MGWNQEEGEVVGDLVDRLVGEDELALWPRLSTRCRMRCPAVTPVERFTWSLRTIHRHGEMVGVEGS